MAERARVGIGYLLAGAVLYLAFFALGETAAGLDIRFQSPWTMSTRGEAYFWAASAFMLLPACFCVGMGLLPKTEPVVRRVLAGIRGMEPKEYRMLLVTLGIVATALAHLGHDMVLMGTAVTDDEGSARFGGQALALGKALMPMPRLGDVLPHLFMLSRNGGWSPLDFTGVQLAWAVSTLTKSGPWIFHLASMLPVPALAYLLGRRLGMVWGVVAVFLWACSPMVVTLSYTTHAHLLSRGALAVAFAAFLAPKESQNTAILSLGAVALAAAVVTRPFEVLALLFPIAAFIVLPGVKAPGVGRRVFAFAAVGLLLAVCVTAAHNWGVSGSVLHSARFMKNEFPHPYASHFTPPWDPGRFWERFGANTSYNAFMLAIWFLGPVGLVLAFLGISCSKETKCIAVGVALDLALGLLHDDHGLHIVGPIHYSECAVPLTILAVFGLHRAVQWARARSLPTAPAAAVLVVMLPLSLGTFSFRQAEALHDQATIHTTVSALIDQAVTTRPAILLAPTYGNTWQNVPAFRYRGSYVFEWPRPTPTFSEDVLILHDVPRLEGQVRRQFPNRAVYRLSLLTTPPWLQITPVP